MDAVITEERQKKPDWLRVKLPIGESIGMYVHWLTHINSTPFAKAEIVRTWVNVGARVLPLS